MKILKGGNDNEKSWDYCRQRSSKSAEYASSELVKSSIKEKYKGAI